jgi:HEAT repeat protein
MKLFNSIWELSNFFFTRACARNRRRALVLLLLPVACFGSSLTFSQASRDLKNSDLSHRAAAIQALKNFGPQGAVSALSAALGAEKDQHLQAAILDSLTTLKDLSAIAAIAPLLSAPTPFVRQKAAYAIGLLGGPQAEKALSAALPRERDTYVRSTELMGLSLCGSMQSLGVIQAALEDKQPEVRSQAIQALRRIPGNAAVKALRGHSESDPKLQKRIREAIQEKASGAQ